MKITSVEILDEEGERALGKPRGTYVTLECMPAHEPAAFAAQSALLSRHIRALLPVGAHVLVAGLGNEAVTPDAVGPEALRNLIVTRHLKRTMPEVFAPFSTVSAIAPGVLGTTGMESAELLAAAVRQIQPDAVIAVDAVASCEPERLCAAVQLSTAGITPGSGVGNARAAFQKKTLGVPVYAVGVPTVVDAASLTGRGGEEMIVTPRDIDAQIRYLSAVLSGAINLALHPGFTEEDFAQFVLPA